MGDTDVSSFSESDRQDSEHPKEDQDAKLETIPDASSPEEPERDDEGEASPREVVESYHHHHRDLRGHEGTTSSWAENGNPDSVQGQDDSDLAYHGDIDSDEGNSGDLERCHKCVPWYKEVTARSHGWVCCKAGCIDRTVSLASSRGRHDIYNANGI